MKSLNTDSIFYIINIDVFSYKIMVGGYNKVLLPIVGDPQTTSAYNISLLYEQNL